MNPAKILEKASSSKFHLWLLNQSLDRYIPFNQPHKFRIVEVERGYVKILLPYRRRNLNHIKGIHACALATVAEFATGFTLLSSLPAKEYRLIMKRINMEYHYQGKMNVYAEFRFNEDQLRSEIIDPLKEIDSVEIDCAIKLHDLENNHISTGNVLWHVKNWSKVKTKI